MRPGDNLWLITEKYLEGIRYWPRLQALNKVVNPRRMSPGMRLRIPVAWLKIQPTPVEVLHVQNEAQARLARTGQSIPLKVGLRLRAGDEIHTGSDSNVTLQFADGSLLLIEANSRLVLDAISIYGGTGMVDTRMRLQHGRLNNRVTSEQVPGMRYEIETPAATSTVRGTEYRISAASDPPVSRPEVLDGRVRVKGEAKTVVVRRGFGTVTRLGAAPAVPTPLLPPPDLSALPAVVERVPIQLSFPPLDGAVAYRTQIAPDRTFKTLLFDGKSDFPQFRGPDLPDNHYVLRIRGIDSQQLEGRDAYRRFMLDARPEPPLLIAPTYDETVRDSSPTFQWAKPEGATGYHFQLAEGSRFAAPITNIPAQAETELALDRSLLPGIYYWRVATRTDSGETGPFSDPQRFEIKPAPASPPLEEPQVDENHIVFRWSAGLPGQTYQFQMTRDARFESFVVDSRLAEPQVTVSRPASGFYYLRIRTLDTDGFVGPYGATQRINVPPNYWLLAVYAIVALLFAL